MTSKCDIVIYGASGFTGKFVVKELCSLASAGLFPNLTWAIAGRSRERLELVLNEVLSEYPGIPVPHILIADAGHEDLNAAEGPPQSLLHLAKSAKVVLNCVGPYRFTGENVVCACLESGTDYLDLCGEPEFIEKMILRYHDLALRKGVTIVHAAAFDSVPADLGALFAKRKLIERGAVPSSVEMFFKLVVNGEVTPGINYATYQSAVEGFASVGELRKIRKSLQAKQPRPPIVGRKLTSRKGPFGQLPPYFARMNGYLVPYMFADPAIVRQTQVLDIVHSTRSPPIQFGAYLVVPSTRVLLILMFYFLIFNFLVARKWGRDLLLRHPNLFTRGTVHKGGPPIESIRAVGFSETFLAKGYSAEVDPKSGAKPDVEVITRVTGPELGYVATPILFLFCTKVLLEERRSRAAGGGSQSSGRLRSGVLTPAVAFGDTDLIEQLSRDGRITFSVLQQ